MVLIIRAILFRVHYILEGTTLEMSKKKKQPSTFELAKESITHYFATKRSGQLLFVSQARLQKKFKTYYAAVNTKGITIFEYNKDFVGKIVVVEDKQWSLFNRVIIDHYFVKSLFSFEGEEGVTWEVTIHMKGKEVQQAIASYTQMEITVVRRPIWRKVAGFRSVTPWKMLTATFLYSVLISIILTNFIPQPIQYTISVLSLLVFFIILFIIIVGLVKPRWVLPKFKHRTRKKALYYYSYLLLIVMPMIVAFAQVEEKDNSKVAVAMPKVENDVKEVKEEETRPVMQEVEESVAYLAKQKQKVEEKVENVKEQRAAKQVQEEAERQAQQAIAKKEQEEAMRQAKLKAEQAAKQAAAQQAKKETTARQAEVERKQANANVSYKNCKEVKAAGAAPLRKGQPGYSPNLDGDKDGVACER
jgi:colicin import membrane protein